MRLAGRICKRAERASRRRDNSVMHSSPADGSPRTDAAAFRSLSPCALADQLTGDRVLDFAIRPLWAGMPRVAGPAFPVRCPPGDNLMLHAAIHRAPPGSVVVVAAGDAHFAVAGGNVCAVAQKRGIAAFVVDGVIRDLAEVRAARFPVFARGVSPIPGKKAALDVFNGTVRCGGVEVAPGDMVVADEEGIVVIPLARCAAVLAAAQAGEAACPDRDPAQALADWEAAHRARIDEILRGRGFAG